MNANEILRSKFNFEKLGYTDITDFVDTSLGFSFKKEIKGDKDHVSAFQMYVPNRVYDDASIKRKPLYVQVTYGKQTGRGVSIEDIDLKNLAKPITVEFRTDFFYDISDAQLYKGDRKISGDELLGEVYSKHVKPTRIFKGLFLRYKIKFWKIWVPPVLRLLAKPFQWALYIISGDVYSYSYIFQEENLNGTIISSRFLDHVGIPVDRSLTKPQIDEKKAKEVEFFGFSVPRWPILFYSIVHLGLWFVFRYKHISTKGYEEIIDNSFLVILYAILSFWLLETVLPYLLKILIKWLSHCSAWCFYKNIKV